MNRAAMGTDRGMTTDKLHYTIPGLDEDAARTTIGLLQSRLHAANNVTGFASFGEQWGSMHVNQTFTGIAIGRAAPP